MKRIHAVAMSALLVIAAGDVSADTFARVVYEARTDELIVTILYRGTNPDHGFSLKWDACNTHDDGSNSVAGELIDSQARDAARQEFRKTLHLSLEGLSCRPANVTVHLAPRGYFSLRIPAAPSA